MNEFSLTAMRDEFERAAREWICEGYQVQLRYVARRNGDALNIVHAMVLFHAWLDGDKDVEQFNFHITAGDFEIGQKVMQSVSLSAAIRSLDEALNGEIRLLATEMSLAPGTGMLHHLRGPARDPWVNMIHMSVSALGAEQLIIPPTLDDQLRRADVPFDGYGDVLQWLSLNEFHHPAGVPSIAVVVHPPAMIAIGDGRLGNGKLTVVIEVMPAIDVETVTVAAMGSPPAGVSLRRQLRPLMQWTLDESRRRGVATIELPEAYMALVALSIGNSYVQRQWYSDPSLSKNVRFAATQEFDHDLAKIKDRLKTTDARAFEKAVAALLFLSGFAPLLPMGDDSPDVVGVTPGGQVVLIECTVKTTDAVRKIGNLVSRREALRAAFLRGKHTNSVLTVLVCMSPRSHIHATDAELADHDVLLITREGLDRQAIRVHNPVDADELCNRGRELLQRLKARLAL